MERCIREKIIIIEDNVLLLQLDFAPSLTSIENPQTAAQRKERLREREKKNGGGRHDHCVS